MKKYYGSIGIKTILSCLKNKLLELRQSINAHLDTGFVEITENHLESDLSEVFVED